MDNIRANIQYQLIWVSIGEIEDATGRNVTYVLLDALSPDKEIASKQFLLHTALVNTRLCTTAANNWVATSIRSMFSFL